MLNVTHWGISV